MSGVYRRDTFSERDALLYFFEHSIAKKLSTNSSNAVVFLLTYNGYFGGCPYLKIYYNISENRIDVVPVTELVLKLIPLDSVAPREGVTHYNSYHQLEFGRDNFGLDKKVISYIHDWEQEITLQKIAFISTFMMDFQMKAVTPNIISSFLVNYDNKDVFKNTLHYEPDNRSEAIMEKFLTQLFIDYHEGAKGRVPRSYTNYKIGCILMEFIPDSREFATFPCMRERDVREDRFGSQEDFDSYLQYKSYALIEIDKCSSTGIRHNDLHSGNVLAYTDENNIPRACIIDFGNFANQTSGGMTCSTQDRKRKFNELKIVDEVYKRPTSRDEHDNYLDQCLIRYNSVERTIPDKGKKIVGLRNWNDPFLTRETYREKRKNKYLGPDYIYKLRESSYKFVDVDGMNDLDKRMVRNGLKLKELLMQELGVEDMSHFIEEDTKDLGRYTGNYKNGGNALLQMYIKRLGLGDTCFEMITSTSQDPYCIQIFNTTPPDQQSDSFSERYPVVNKEMESQGEWGFGGKGNLPKKMLHKKRSGKRSGRRNTKGSGKRTTKRSGKRTTKKNYSKTK
uniref:Protein kinase domain-containing protein n=1 Tax=viral metagenome TaxID=1070528 RepID=A0A6C0B197_9ZZZZ